MDCWMVNYFCNIFGTHYVTEEKRIKLRNEDRFRCEYPVKEGLKAINLISGENKVQFSVFLRQLKIISLRAR